MSSGVDDLLRLLDLEPLEVGLFRGFPPANPSRPDRVYGGHVAAQAMAAAQLTVPEDCLVHSFHAYFILAGDATVPVVYDVENVRDGRTFRTRRVAARQHGEIIFYMTASFQRDEPGLDHQDAMPPVMSPEDATPLADLVKLLDPAQGEQWSSQWGAIDLRYVGDDRPADDPLREREPGVQRFWFRTESRLPSDDPRLHVNALTYMSDLTLLGASLVPHGKVMGDPSIMPASLDHTLWFHRRFRADEWLLYDQHSPSASGARGLATARIFDQQGRLVASAAQEGLIRPIAKRS